MSLFWFLLPIGISVASIILSLLAIRNIERLCKKRNPEPVASRPIQVVSRDTDGKARQESEDDFNVRMFYDEKKCPCCGGTEFIEGPQGALCTNIKCSNCGTKWNVCPPMHYIERI